jgi:uncharacterized protein (TIGR02145 family)
VTHYRNGDPISNITDDAEWASTTEGAYCDYGNEVGNGDIYGRLYNWYAIGDSRNIAPLGWRVATQLDGSYYLMPHGNANAAAELKETGTEHWVAPNTGAIDIYGFTALPGGFRDLTGQFDSLGYFGYYWYSFALDDNNALIFGLKYDSPDFYFSYADKHKGLSIRCVKE